MHDQTLPREARHGARADLAFGASEVVALGSVSIIAGGVTLGRSLSGSDSIELPYLRVANVQDGFIDTSEMKTVRILRTELERYRLHSGDVLMTEGGDFDKLGRGAVWDGSIDPCLHQNHIFRVRCNPSALLPKYLAMYSASPIGRRLFLLLSKQTTNLASINLNQLKTFPVPIPPLQEQRQITEVLDSADEAIRSTEELIAKLERTGQGFRHDVLRRGIDEAGELRDPIRRGAFVNSKLGLIPRDWRIVSAANIASESRGSLVIGPFGSDLVANDYRSSGVPVIFVRDVRPDDFSWISDVYVSEQKAAELSAHTVLPGDLVITKMGLPPAIAAVYPDEQSLGVVTADIIRLRPNVNIVDPAWLSLAINSDSTRRQIATITGGVTRPKITLRDFRTILITLPPIGEQRAISDRVRALTVDLLSARQERDKLLLLKSGLLDDLLRGRVGGGALR
jgi:type I restriction enzyme S subunit